MEYLNRATDLFVGSRRDLADALGAKTISEGVETADDLALLRRLGCRAGQGFYWSPAVSPPELAELTAGLLDERFCLATSPLQAPKGRLPPPRLKTSNAVTAELTRPQE